MIQSFTAELASRVDLSTALGLADDLDYDFAAVRPTGAPAIVSPYFADWDFDLPSIHCNHVGDGITPLAS